VKISTQHFERWFKIQGANNDAPLLKLSLFDIEKALEYSIGTINAVGRIHSGELVEAASAAQTHSICKLTSLANFAVTVSAYRTLNTCEGVYNSYNVVNIFFMVAI